jgi:hypothetical protein
MLRQSVLVMCCVLGLAGSALAGLDPDLAVYWPLDEGAGTVANDLTGNGHNGTISAGPAWVTPGKIGSGALQFTGSGDVRGSHVALDSRSFTIAMWVNPTLPSGSQIVFSTQSSSATALNLHLRLGGPGASDAPVNGIRFGFYNIDLDSPANVLTANTWQHLTFRYDFTAQQKTLFLNGTQIAQNTSTAFLATTGDIILGSWAGGNAFTGMVDDFQIYQRALTPAEVGKIMAGLADASLAQNPVPDDETTDVPLDTKLSWTAGEFAATHDVYFGTNFDDVNTASRSNPMGLLVSQAQADAEYAPVLEYGQTYYWRVDEVNAAPDNTIFKGEVWTFTAEPFAYPIADVTATASSFQPGMGPENTINGSGLSAADEHSMELKQMWMTIGGFPAWIQYEFAQVEKLHEMWVWNSNQILESFLGFGAKSVVVEYSLDGETWATLEGVTEFAKATSAATYAHNTTVDFGGVMAKFVKITINNNWGGAIPQTGLAEVRFFYVPVKAFEPTPAVAATGVSVNTNLAWRPGREATSHKVYIGTDNNAVAGGAVTAATAAGHAYTPASLDFATTYYWKVDEVGDAGTYAGNVWNFTTEEFAVIDNFETYNDDVDAGTTIWHAWIDGVTTKASGSQVGYDESPFAEKKVIHGGVQAMPMMYDNSASPFYSEAEYTFATPKDLTAGAAESLRLYYRGVAPAFVETASGSILMNGIGADIWGTSDQFRYAYKSLSGNGSMIARVNSIYNSNAWAKAGVMIRQSVEPGSIHAFMALTPGGSGGGNGASFQRRTATASDSANTDATTVFAPPYWVKIDRTGDKFSVYISPDGAAWTQLGESLTIAMPGSVLIGLAVCSHDAAVATGAEFSDVKTTGNVTGAWQIAEIGIAQPTGNSVEPVYVTVKDNSGKSKTVVSADAFATAQMGWQQWLIPLSEFSSAGVKTNAVKSIVVGVGNKTSPTKGGAGIVYIDDIGFGRSLQ